MNSMLELLFENGGVEILAFLALGSLILGHWFLFREYAIQGKQHRKKLSEMESQVRREILRSQSLSRKEVEIDQIQEKTQEKLEVIKLLVEGMRMKEQRDKSD